MRTTSLLCLLCSMWLALAATDFNVPPRTRFKYTCACDAVNAGNIIPCYIQSGQLCSATASNGACSPYAKLCTEDISPASLAAPALTSAKIYRISYVPNPYIPTSRSGRISNPNYAEGTATFIYDDGTPNEPGVTFDMLSSSPCATYLDEGNTFISVGGCIAALFLSVILTGFLIGR